MKLPEPMPVIWAPRFRRALVKWFARMDRRAARKVHAGNVNVYNAWWRRTYDQWWHDTGWAQGALPLEAKWAEMKRRGIV